jgi:hypothetical protein
MSATPIPAMPVDRGFAGQPEERVAEAVTFQQP